MNEDGAAPLSPNVAFRTDVDSLIVGCIRVWHDGTVGIDGQINDETIANGPAHQEKLSGILDQLVEHWTMMHDLVAVKNRLMGGD